MATDEEAFKEISNKLMVIEETLLTIYDYITALESTDGEQRCMNTEERESFVNKKIELSQILSEKVKVVGYTYRIPKFLQDEFKQKCLKEGFSVQEGIARLIEAYVEERIRVGE